MTITPPQGLSHAATLLLTHRMRAIQSDASRESITAALCQLVEDLAAWVARLKVRRAAT